MKQFLTVYKFEVLGLMKTKAFKVVTTILCLAAIIGLSIPSIFGEIGGDSSLESAVTQQERKGTIALYDPADVLADQNETLKLYFPKAKFERVDSIDQVKKMMEKDDAIGGFSIKDDLNFVYYVNDSSLMDTNMPVFKEAMSQVKRNIAFEDEGIDSDKVMKIYYSASVEGTQEILGSDGASNYMYTIGLIALIYMVLILYGTMIATSVASEKGNRTMELLVTSANSNSLIFGKVLAGATTAFLQIGLFITCAVLTYRFNGSAWNGLLDAVFNIPGPVIGAFALFGMIGFIFYAFIFGTLGALVSKSEDVNSSVTPLTIIFVIVYMIVVMGINAPDSPIFTIASLVPFSSPMAMFARMAMVEVPLIEIILSLALLLVSTAIVGFVGAKIYRRGTLMYGNQVKLVHALKWIKKDK